MRGALRPGALAALLAASTLGPGTATAHSTGPALPDAFIQGAFAPAFVPPEPGSYELPAIKRVGTFTLRDTAGRAVDTRAVMAGKIAVVSFIYTASGSPGLPLASQTLRDLRPGSARRASRGRPRSSRSASIPSGIIRPSSPSTLRSTTPIPRSGAS
jgi:hypothetical protein